MFWMESYSRFQVKKIRQIELRSAQLRCKQTFTNFFIFCDFSRFLYRHPVYFWSSLIQFCPVIHLAIETDFLFFLFLSISVESIKLVFEVCLLTASAYYCNSNKIQFSFQLAQISTEAVSQPCNRQQARQLVLFDSGSLPQMESCRLGSHLEE